MKIECILHRNGGTVVEMPGKTYHFKPQADGRHVADVTIDAHIERFLSIHEAYRIARSPGADAATEIMVPGKTADMLPPMSIEAGQQLKTGEKFPAEFVIEGKVYALADVTLRAFQDSGLTVEDWNELDDEVVSTKTEIVLDALEAGEITLPPAAPPAPAQDDRAALVAAYSAKFGKVPPANMKVETIKAKLAE